MIYVQTAALILGLYALTLFMGIGLASLLCPDDREDALIFAPWAGIAMTAFVLIAAGFLGRSVGDAFWLPIVLSTCFLALAIPLGRFSPDIGALKWHAAFAAVFVFIIVSPVLFFHRGLAGVSIGNLDLYDYVMCADYLNNHTVARFLTPLGQNPSWPDATLQERVVAWQFPSTRWVSYFFLSFLSTVFRRDPAELFTLYIAFLIALFIPVVWKFAKNRLSLEKPLLTSALALIVLNPHVLYIAFHGFLPQICATGFLACALYFLDRAAEDRSAGSRVLLGLFSAGVLGSYPELFTFLVIIAAAYCAGSALFRNLSVRDALLLFSLVLLGPALIYPYQAYRYGPMMIFNTQIIDGGWDVTKRFYLFFFMMGGNFAHPFFPRPVPWLEWITGPILLVLFLYGIWNSKRRVLLLSVLAPFLLAGTLSYFRGWNYRYFKNFTYAYYLVPLILALGLQRLAVTAQAVRVAKFSIIALMVIAGAKSLEAIYLSAHCSVVPVHAKPLESFRSDPDVQTVLLGDIGFWDGMWASYYLRNKVFNVSNDKTPYMRCEAKKAGKYYTHVLTGAKNAARLGGKILFESGDIAFVELPGIKNP